MNKLLFIFITFTITTSTFSQQWKLPVVVEPKFKKDSVNIVKSGAVSDGYTLNTKSINTTIEDLSKKGGGVVVVPAGLWLTGPVVLKNNINLYLASGATLLFTNDQNQYPLIKGNWEGLPHMRNQSPISATGSSNIAITGKGIIDGNGDGWRAVKSDKLTASQWKKLIGSGGLVSEVVEPERLLPRCRELAREIIDNAPPLTAQLFKLALTESLHYGLEDAVRFAERAQKIARASEDHAEALKAYAEKRSPQWKGR